jgi:hypothetical protein
LHKKDLVGNLLAGRKNIEKRVRKEKKRKRKKRKEIGVSLISLLLETRELGFFLLATFHQKAELNLNKIPK